MLKRCVFRYSVDDVQGFEVSHIASVASIHEGLEGFVSIMLLEVVKGPFGVPPSAATNGSGVEGLVVWQRRKFRHVLSERAQKAAGRVVCAVLTGVALVIREPVAACGNLRDGLQAHVRVAGVPEIVEPAPRAVY